MSQTKHDQSFIGCIVCCDE